MKLIIIFSVSLWFLYIYSNKKNNQQKIKYMIYPFYKGEKTQVGKMDINIIKTINY